MLIFMEARGFFNSSPPSLGRDDEKQYLLLENVRLRKALRAMRKKSAQNRIIDEFQSLPKLLTTPKAQRYVPTLPSVQEIPSPPHASLPSSAEASASYCRGIESATISSGFATKQQPWGQFSCPDKRVDLEQEDSCYEEHSTSASSPASYPSKPAMIEEQMEDETPSNLKDCDRSYSLVASSCSTPVSASCSAAQSAMLDCSSDAEERDPDRAIAVLVFSNQSSSLSAEVGDAKKGATEVVIREGVSDRADSAGLLNANAIVDEYGTSAIVNVTSAQEQQPPLPLSPLTEAAEMPTKSELPEPFSTVCSVSSGNRDGCVDREVVSSSRQLRPRIYRTCYKEPSMRKKLRRDTKVRAQ